MADGPKLDALPPSQRDNPSKLQFKRGSPFWMKKTGVKGIHQTQNSGHQPGADELPKSLKFKKVFLPQFGRFFL